MVVVWKRKARCSRELASSNTSCESAPASAKSPEGCWGPGKPPASQPPPPAQHHSLMAMCTESSGCEAVSAQMCRLCTASTPPTASSVSRTALKSIPLGVPGGTRGGMETRHPREGGHISSAPGGLPTLHEDEEDVAEDGQRCPQHQHGEEEGADGVHVLVFRLGGVGAGETPPSAAKSALALSPI